MSKPLCTIVGMGPGLSFSIAKRFAKEGFKIAMVARNLTKLDDYEEQFREMDYTAHGFVGDVSNFEQLQKTFEEIKEQLGETDILVYNVSVYREANPTELAADDCMEDLRANVAGALVAVQAVIPHMKEQKKGTILITGGGTAIEPPPVLSSLAIGKAAIRNLALSLYAELKPFGIHVATVTINGAIDPSTKFAPNLISEEFWKLHNQPAGEFEREVVYG